MKLNTKVLVSIALACLICTVSAVIVSTSWIISRGEMQHKQKSAAILSRLEAVRSYIASQGGLVSTIEDAVRKYPDGNLAPEEKLKILKQVPIFASMKVGAENAKEEGYAFRVFSTEPRNKDNQATQKEAEILARFSNDPNLKEISESTDSDIIVYRPVRLSESQGCLQCHGNPEKSPWKNGKDILGYPMENWKDGKLHGVFALTASKAEIKAAAWSATWNIVMWAGLLSIVAMIFGFFLLKRSMTSLSGIAEQLQKMGTEVAQASQEITASSASLSTASTNAASSIEQTTAATEQMYSMIRLNADHTTTARNLAEEAQAKARHGKSEIEHLVFSMDDIAKSSKKIEEIITVIDDIAFQTNLLALNAAVEAARAGEQGKGFAVVAEAVRALAQRSATSAREISSLIRESVEKIDKGHSVVQSSGQMLSEIVTQIDHLTTLNIEISTASKEQAQGVNSINTSINELDKITQNNAQAAVESSNSADILENRSTQMHAMVQELINVVEGKKAA